MSFSASFNLTVRSNSDKNTIGKCVAFLYTRTPCQPQLPQSSSVSVLQFQYFASQPYMDVWYKYHSTCSKTSIENLQNWRVGTLISVLCESPADNLFVPLEYQWNTYSWGVAVKLVYDRWTEDQNRDNPNVWGTCVLPTAVCPAISVSSPV